MTRTVLQGFEKLKDNLLITDLQEDTVSERQRMVRDAVKSQMDVLASFIAGSYKRSTMIAPLSQADIDIFIVLDQKYYSDNGQVQLLDKVKSVLKQAYPRTSEISRDGQAVTISFSDFDVDVVPAFYRKGFLFQYRTNSFLIANSITKKWIPTNPLRHVEIWSKANKAHNGDLIPFIKMIKAWNKENGKPLTSFHLECLILNIMNYEGIKNFHSAIRFFFDKARRAIRYSVSDPAGYNSDVGTYLNTQDKKEEVIKKMELSYYRAKNAEEWVKKDNIEDAYYYWKKIFGDYFPSYSLM